MPYFLRRQPGLKGHVTVGFDPRGTGGSSPNMTCNGAPGFRMDPRDRSKPVLDLVESVATMTTAYCSKLSRGLSPYITTEQTVQDLDLLRQLLRTPTIDYLGYGAGAWLGAHYQKRFPKAVGRFVFDSNVDFTRPWKVTFDAQPEAFERRFREDFARWAVKHQAALKIGSTPAEVVARYERLRALLVEEPVVFPYRWNTQGEFTAVDLDQEINSRLYSKEKFVDIAITLRYLLEVAQAQEAGGAAGADRAWAAVPAEAREVLTRQEARTLGGRQAGPDLPFESQTSPEGFYAITRNDTAWPQGQAYYDRLAAVQGPKYPLVGWSVNQQPCAHWKRPNVDLPTPDGAGIGATLMVQAEHDPATNSRLAADAHARYQGSVLITVTDEGDHGIYGGDNTCVNTLVNTFFRTGRAPATDTTCQGKGIPAPAPLPGRRKVAPQNPLTQIAEISQKLAAATR